MSVALRYEILSFVRYACYAWQLNWFPVMTITYYNVFEFSAGSLRNLLITAQKKQNQI